MTRLEVVLAARKKFNDRRIALEEINGVFTLKALTGIWNLDTSTNPHTARETSKIYWQGASLKEAETAVK